jgi:hypothetical protein
MGYLAATATHQTTKDSATHTTTHTFAITPGELYHFASIDTSALTPDQQAAFAKLFHPAPGVVADKTLTFDIFRTLMQIGVGRSATINVAANNLQHTVVIVLKPKPTHP